tara:strand:+ start:2022 stop:2690 length:669 start_codon:yes stop_codon:yes gene_type:complete
MKKSKLAFVHFGKCAGSYVSRWLETKAFYNSDYKIYNSWVKRLPETYKGRDWTKEELSEISNDEGPAYVHNHHIAWSKSTISEFNEKGWTTFTFIRKPEDLICSLYCWSKQVHLETGKNPLMVDSHEWDMDVFIHRCIDTALRNLWVLPDYINEVKDVREFNHSNLQDFIRSELGIGYTPIEKQNASSNKGFRWFRENDRIHEKTEERLFNDPDFEKYSLFI